MSLSHQVGRRCLRFVSQLRKSRSPSLLPTPPSAHLGLQSFRLNGFSIRSSSCLHHFSPSPSFSTVAETARMENSADAEASPPVDSVTEKPEATSSSDTALKPCREQEETVLKKMLEEQRELVTSLRAELEDQKTLTRSILNEIRVLKSNVDAKADVGAESNDAAKKHLCLEWVAFMEHLQDSEFFNDENGKPSSDSGSVLNDPTRVRKAICKFARANESVFESLSPIDLRIIARHGTSANDPRASAAQNRLCQFFHVENLSSDTGAAKVTSTQPNLSDVTRLLYSTVLESTYGDDVKSCISHLLREIVTLSKKPSVEPLPAAGMTLNSKLRAALSTAALDMTGQSKQEKEKNLKKETDEEIQKVSSAKREEAMKVVAKAEAKPETSGEAPQWKCPRCSFMNLDSKHRCVECSRRRPQHTYGYETLKGTDGVSLVAEDTNVKVPVEERQFRKESERKASLPSTSSQGRESSKHRSSSADIQEQDTLDVEDSSSESDIGSEGSDTFSVLDDILESEDYSDKQQEDSKIAALSDDSEEEQQGTGKRTPLSKLFPQNMSRSSSRRDGQRGLEQRNGKKSGDRLSRRKRFEDDGDNGRFRHGSVEYDSEDDDPPQHKSGRGFGFQSDDYSRKSGRGASNSFRGRGGFRGSGGSRADSFEGGRGEGYLRGSSAHGNRDRGGRPSNSGSRSSRGRPRF